MGVIFSAMLSRKRETTAGPDLTREWESKKMRKRYIREQKTLCGEKYMEVDLNWITEQQHRATSRGKKALASTLAQQDRNAGRAGRYFIQLVNSNFDWMGLHVAYTYDDAYLPESAERAERDLTNYLRRVRRWISRQGWDPAGLRWISVTEGQDEDKAAGQKAVRWHHHLLIQMDGLGREQREKLRGALEDLWSVRFCGEVESLGTVNADRLQPDKDGLVGLALYLLKYPKRKKRWHQSQGLRKPRYPRPNDTRWSARKLAEACTLEVDDADAWEKRYPGWKFLGAHPSWNEERGEWRVYIRLYRKEERQKARFAGAEAGAAAARELKKRTEGLFRSL